MPLKENITKNMFFILANKKLFFMKKHFLSVVFVVYFSLLFLNNI